MWRRYVFVRALGLVFPAILCSARAAVPAQPASIVAIRHFATVAHTRLVVELSGPAVSVVSSVPPAGQGPPRRIYVDLPGVGIAPRLDKSLDLPKGPLAAVRVGKRDLTTARVVIAVRAAEVYRTSQLSGPPRIVIDVRAPHRREGKGGPAGTGSPPSKRGGGEVRAAAPRPAGATPTKRVGGSQSSGRSAPVHGTNGSGKPPSPSATAPLRIVIDPGHGGKDPGARGVGGILEKTVVLAIAQGLARRLRQDPGAAVVLTREGDEFVSLEARTVRANAERADLFISIHANANGSADLAGVETYYLNNTNDRATIRLAAMENGLKLVGGAPTRRDLSYILSDLVQQGKLEDSITLSKALHRELIARLRHAHRDVVDLGVKQGPFYVLVGAHMPCVLVEVAFLTNPVEGRRLGTVAYQDAIADGLAAGVRRYADHLRRARTL